MFGSISNWINTNLPQANLPSMPNLPNMPNLPAMPTLPVIPDLFGKNKNENEDSTELIDVNENQNKSTPKQENNENQTKVENEKNEAEQNEQTDSKAGIETAIDTAKELGNSAKELLGNTTELLGSTTSNIGNMIFSFGKNASSNVLKTATHLKDVIEKKTIIGDFTKENEKFLAEKKNSHLREDAALPPWVGYNEEEKLKEEIMSLSTDSRNFMRSPPVGVEFQFDFNVAYPVALATLEEDPNLKEMRFKLVPSKIKEENFWRNYFYRVSLIKQTIQLGELAEQKNGNSVDSETDSIKTSDSKHQINASDSMTNNLANNEFVSDSYDHASINADEIQSDLKQLKLDNKKDELDDTEWDKELPEDLDSISAEELEKEINQMIGKQ